MSSKFQPGMIFHEEVLLSTELVETFAAFSGDRNPLHLEENAALTYGYARPVAHGAIQSAVVSRLIGMQVPGPGAVWMSQNMEWLRPAFVGDSLRVEAEIESYSEGAEMMRLQLRAINGQGQQVMQGSAKVKVAPQVAAGHSNEEEKETRVALVTGASRGIGAAIACALGESGFHVAISYRSDLVQAAQVQAEIKAASSKASCHPVDLSVSGSGQKLVHEVIKKYGRIDVIVHAATQRLPDTSALDCPVEDIRSCMRMHVEAALELIQAAAPGMSRRKYGRVILLGTSSLFGQPPAKMCAYITAKQALWGITRCLAAELGPHQVTVNMISPGMTVTDLTSDVPSRIKEVEARRIPLRRLAVPADTAKLVGFLASDQAGYVSGQNFPLTGGPV